MFLLFFSHFVLTDQFFFVLLRFLFVELSSLVIIFLAQIERQLARLEQPRGRDHLRRELQRVVQLRRVQLCVERQHGRGDDDGDARDDADGKDGDVGGQRAVVDLGLDDLAHRVEGKAGRAVEGDEARDASSGRGAILNGNDGEGIGC